MEVFQKCICFQICCCGLIDVDSVWNLHEEFLGQELWQAYGVDVVLCLAVCDHDRHEVLHDVTPAPPRLPESQEEVRGGRLPLDDGIVLESRSEMVCVIEDLSRYIFVELSCFLSRRGRTGAVHDCSAERGHTDPSLVVNVEDYPVPHGVEDILGKSLRVVLGEKDWVRVAELLLVFRHCGSVGAIRNDATRSV